MTIQLLLDREGPRIDVAGQLDGAPALDSLGPTIQSLRAGQAALRSIAVDDLLGLFDAAASAWTRPEHPLSDVIRRHGLGFLPLWMRRKNLQNVCARALRGHPEALDRFVRLSDADAMLVRAQPRGLVVHWVAGNVPVLGMLSLLQSLLCKNANLVKVSHVAPGLLPGLVQGFAGVTYRNANGETVSGQTLLGAVAVVYADRADRAAARELSLSADVRVVWGGREALEAVVNQPRRIDAEDIVFGPKLSLAAVAAERLGDPETARRTAAAIAADASAVDQQGCNSPHTVFVERGGLVDPAQFARLLADAMEIENRRTPLAQVDPVDAMNVLSVRTRYDMLGQAYYSRGMGWTVVYSDDDAGLPEPCFLRTLFVRPVDDLFSIVPLCGRGIQTAGLAVDARRLALADALTAAGVDRCPNVGAMRLYDTPWDGLFPMERLVRWVSAPCE
jgi:hypothetical protein